VILFFLSERLLSAMVLWAVVTSAIAGCATGGGSQSGDRGPASTADSDGKPSRAHPATYFIDQFRVNRPIPQHSAKNNEPFFFKRCAEVGGEGPYSRTAYGCNYP